MGSGTWNKNQALKNGPCLASSLVQFGMSVSIRNLFPINRLKGCILCRGGPILVRCSHHSGFVNAKVQKTCLFWTTENHKSAEGSCARG